MSNDTFLELKKRAEVAERMQLALRISEQRVQTLEKSNKEKDKELGEMFNLRIENGYLKKQIEFFKQVIDKIRDMLSAQRDKDGNQRVTKKLMEHAIGYAKEYVGQKMNMKKEATPRNENEEIGRNIAIKSLATKQKEKGYGTLGVRTAVF